jgi:CBS domain-containing protein
VRTEYTADFLDRVLVRDAATREVVTLAGDDTLSTVRGWLAIRSRATTHQGFPVIEPDGALIGVVTRRDLLDERNDAGTRVRDIVTRTPVVVFEDNTLREAADHMVRAGVGRLPVLSREGAHQVVGILSRSDLLTAHQPRLDAALITETPPIGRRWARTRAARMMR